MSPEILFSIIIGIAAFYLIISLGKEEKDLDPNTAKRLTNIKNKTYGVSDEAVNLQFEDQTLAQNIKMIIQDTEYKVQMIGDVLNKFEVTAKVKRMLKIADIKMPVDVFMLIPVILVAPFLLLILIIPSKVLFFLTFGAIAAYMPFMIVKIKIKKRLDTFTQQLPDALGLIASSLRAGHSLTASFQMVVQEMPEPVNQIFKIFVDEVSLGGNPRDALDNMMEHMPDSLDLRFFVTAVLIQREIGGNLAEILDNLNYTIRERFKLIGQLNAQTAQSKLSGIVLACAPAILGLIIWFMNPSYLEPLFKNFFGQASLVGAIMMAIIGFLIIKKITTIKV